VPNRRGRAASSVRLALAAAIALIALSPALSLTPVAEARSWRYLPPPTGNYSPKHVWQTKDNCIWAAGSMLLDKWSHGRVRASQYTLRKASGDKDGGSTLRDLSRAFAKAARVKLKTPGYGGSMEWWELLDRLESGGGAVVVGEYNRMPPYFSRWSPGYAARRSSGHAVFVERYDRRNGRVWIDDPLAPGGWPGEWIPVDDLRRFADVERGSVQAAATPPRRHPTTAPLVDQAYRLGAPEAAGIVIVGQPLAVSVPLHITGGFPRPAAHRLAATWRLADGSRTEDPPTTRSKPVRPSGSGFRASLPVPQEPGRYIVDLRLAPERGRSPARPVGTVEIRVVGPFAATIAVMTQADRVVGRPVPLTVVVDNVGSVDWRPSPERERAQAAPAAPGADSPAMLTLVWRSGLRPDHEAMSVPVGLAPGARMEVDLLVSAPPMGGIWRLEAVIGHPILGPMTNMSDAMDPVLVTFAEPGAISDI